MTDEYRTEMPSDEPETATWRLQELQEEIARRKGETVLGQEDEYAFLVDLEGAIGELMAIRALDEQPEPQLQS